MSGKTGFKDLSAGLGSFLAFLFYYETHIVLQFSRGPEKRRRKFSLVIDEGPLSSGLPEFRCRIEGPEIK